MATARPVVSIYNFENPSEKTGTVPMPYVLQSPLRPDLVREVHTNMAKNKRQAYAVSPKAGYDTAAESWCTGRAVARIPRDLVVALTVPDRRHLETRPGVEACSTLPRSGAAGTAV